jgi:hypothetical protein
MLIYDLPIDKLDQGDFIEGHELPGKWKVAKEMMGGGYRRWKLRGCWLSLNEPLLRAAYELPTSLRQTSLRFEVEAG